MLVLALGKAVGGAHGDALGGCTEVGLAELVKVRWGLKVKEAKAVPRSSARAPG